MFHNLQLNLGFQMLKFVQICYPFRARKIVHLRLFENEATQKRWDKSVKDIDGEILCVSQVGIFIH